MTDLIHLLSSVTPTQIISVAVTVIAVASGIAKSLEIAVAALTHLFPNDAKADGVLKSIIAFLSTLQSLPILQTCALNPKLGAPSHSVSATDCVNNTETK